MVAAVCQGGPQSKLGTICLSHDCQSLISGANLRSSKKGGEQWQDLFFDQCSAGAPVVPHRAGWQLGRRCRVV